MGGSNRFNKLTKRRVDGEDPEVTLSGRVMEHHFDSWVERTTPPVDESGRQRRLDLPSIHRFTDGAGQQFESVPLHSPAAPSPVEQSAPASVDLRFEISPRTTASARTAPTVPLTGAPAQASTMTQRDSSSLIFERVDRNGTADRPLPPRSTR